LIVYCFALVYRINYSLLHAMFFVFPKHSPKLASNLISIGAKSDRLLATKAGILAIYTFFPSGMQLWYQYGITPTSHFFKAQL